jgi:hypothetical protein
MTGFWMGMMAGGSLGILVMAIVSVLRYESDDPADVKERERKGGHW